MKKLIELDASLDALREVIVPAEDIGFGDELTDGYNDGIEMAITVVSGLPSVDAVPVRHGWWKAVKDGEDDYRRICSCCGEDAPYDESEDVYLIYPYCPWCGANMRKDGGDD